jgi:hypothetical protein
VANSGVTFDNSLVQKSGEGNATLNGRVFRLNPDSVDLSFTIKSSQTSTIGGIVVQVYGLTFSDLVITGSFGAGGWQEQQGFLADMVAIAASQSVQNLGTVPSQPVRFLFPLLNYDFNVYLKDYSSPQGPAVLLDNSLINPQWTLTLFIETDNSNLTAVATDAYIARLATGLGYAVNQFNAPQSSAEVQAYINQYGGGNLPAFINQLYGGPVVGTGDDSTADVSTAPNVDGTGANTFPNPTPGSTLTDLQIAEVAVNAGFTNVIIIGYVVAIALAESSGNTTAIGGGAYGLMQMQQGDPVDILSQNWQDPAVNMAAAYQLSKQGTNFNPWATACSPMPGLTAATGIDGKGSGAASQYLARGSAAAQTVATAIGDAGNPTTGVGPVDT